MLDVQSALIQWCSNERTLTNDDGILQRDYLFFGKSLTIKVLRPMLPLMGTGRVAGMVYLLVKK